MSAENPLDQPLELHRGDSDEILFTVTEPGDPEATRVRLDQAVDGTAARWAILRWTVKRNPRDGQSEALLYKDTQRGSAEFRILDQTVEATEGQAEAFIDPDDTSDTDEKTAGPTDQPAHRHDLEVNRQDEIRAGASVGTVTVENGSSTIIGVGTEFTKAKRWDILTVLDASNTFRPTLITRIVSDTEIEVGRTEWVDVSGEAFEIRRNRRRTAAAGTFKLKTEITSDG